MKSDKVTEYIINHKLFKTTQKKGDFVIKVNYIPIGFTEKFKELYNDLMKWKIDNAFKKSGEEPSDEKPKGDEQSDKKDKPEKKEDEPESDKPENDKKPKEDKPEKNKDKPESDKKTGGADLVGDITRDADQLFTSISFDIPESSLCVETDNGRL